MSRRVLAIALDGYEASLAESMAAQGLLPAYAALKARGSSFVLDHGAARRTGLASEHFSTGLDPTDAERWSAVDFDAKTYRISQQPTRRPPFAASLSARTVVFDAGYFDLDDAPNAQGIVAWGAHDPGVDAKARPDALMAEIHQRFGPYPAPDWIYGFVWPSPARTEAMARDLVRAVEVRADVAEWLLAERLPDWDLGIVMVSEAHSGIEALWHGVDPAHPLHGAPSAAAAGAGVKAIYQAIDRLIGRLSARFPDAVIVLFSMHGMGCNESDAASMVLLPELLYRHSFGHPYMRESAWREGDGPPMLDPDETWDAWMARAVPWKAPPLLERALNRLAGGAAWPSNLDWMPGNRYRRFWPRMKAFALPAFYDGRVRINLAGREAHGLVPPEGYDAACDEVERLVRDCTDLIAGGPVVRSVERSHRGDPRDVGPTEADLVFVWDKGPLGLVHPRLGRIGPAPYRRTGGHASDEGMAVIAGPGVRAGDAGRRSAFDIVPTILALLQEQPNGAMSGVSAEPALL